MAKGLEPFMQPILSLDKDISKDDITELKTVVGGLAKDMEVIQCSVTTMEESTKDLVDCADNGNLGQVVAANQVDYSYQNDFGYTTNPVYLPPRGSTPPPVEPH